MRSVDRHAIVCHIGVYFGWFSEACACPANLPSSLPTNKTIQVLFVVL